MVVNFLGLPFCLDFNANDCKSSSMEARNSTEVPTCSWFMSMDHTTYGSVMCISILKIFKTIDALIEVHISYHGYTIFTTCDCVHLLLWKVTCLHIHVHVFAATSLSY